MLYVAVEAIFNFRRTGFFGSNRFCTRSGARKGVLYRIVRFYRDAFGDCADAHNPFSEQNVRTCGEREALI